MSKDVNIEAICVGDPDFKYQEFVTILNNNKKSINLSGWKIVWKEVPSGRELHSHVFDFPSKGSFDPQEKLFLASGTGKYRFRNPGEDPKCPIAHWVFFTGTPKHICSVPHLKVTLYDSNGNEIDHRYSHQKREEPSVRPAIAIGHGNDPAWRTIKDYLHDLHDFSVDAFEMEPHASEVVPDIIEKIGCNSNMAILVLSGEDKTDAGTYRARQNVIHELGKFQEKFGYKKTIILVERGVEVPSNASGLIRIDYEHGNIGSTIGGIMAAIRREFKLW